MDRKHKTKTVLFCSLAVLDPRVGHTMDVLSPFVPVLYAVARHYLGLVDVDE